MEFNANLFLYRFLSSTEWMGISATSIHFFSTRQTLSLY